jgi:outer membrane protein
MNTAAERQKVAGREEGFVRLVGWLWLILVGAAPVAAGTPVPLTLDDALVRAERDNPELAALRARQAAQEQRAAAASRASWPRLSVSVDAFRTDDPVRVFAAKLGRGEFGADDFAISRLNDPVPISHLSSTLRADVPIDVFGAVHAASRASAAQARAEAAAISEAVQDLRVRVVEAYRRAGLAEAATDVTAHALSGARAREADLQARVEAGAALTADLLRARTRRRQREADLAQREDDRAAAFAVLDRLMGADGMESFVLTEAATAPTPLADDLPAWTEKALASRAQPRGAADRAEAAVEAQRAESRGGRPTLGAYGLVQDDRGSLAAAGGQSFTVGAAVRWTPFDPTRSRRVAAAKADRRAAESQVRAARDQVRLEVALAWRRARTARERYTAAAGGAEEAREALRVVQQRRQAGLATLTDELETESATLAAELEERAASTEVELADAALRRAAGDL